MAYNNELKKLDKIIEETIDSIKESHDEINEISSFAKREYLELEEEFMKLKIEATNVIDRVDTLEVQLKDSKVKLAQINKEFSKYSENEMKAVYDETDALRLDLAVEKEREMNLIKRRNELEIHLKTVRKIADKADKLSQNFDMAFHVISGDLQTINNKIDEVQHKEIWGIKVLQAQENERQRIAREMHDGPAQSLSNLVLKTELCIKLLDKDIERTRLELQSLKTLIRGTIDDTRRLIYNLRPMSIDDLGLKPTLERFIDKTNESLGFNIKLACDSKVNITIDTVTTLALFRITQEALNNMKKYSKASKCLVEVLIEDEHLELTISDNGVGFDVKKVKLNLKDNRGFGMSMIRERTNLLLGECKFASQIGKGTIVKVRIPIGKNKEDEIND